MANLKQAVQSLLDELVDTGEETGLQAAIYLEGELVADCVAGKNNSMFIKEDAVFNQTRIESLIIHEIFTAPLKV